MRTANLVIIAVLTFAPARGALAQVTEPESGTVQEILLADGSVLYGWVLADTDPMRFRLVSGDLLEVARGRVVKREAAPGRVVDGAFWREDPNQTRLFFGPTARGLARGKGYVAAYELFIPFMGIAVTDDLVLAGGTPAFGGMDDRPFWFAPKLRVFSGEKTDVAVGAMIIAVEGESAGVLYGVATRGSADLSGTLGLGYGFAGGGLADRPAVMAGFEARASRTVKLVSENYLFPGGAGLISFGPRFFGERLSADLGLGVLFVGGESATFPIVNFVYVW